MTKTAKLALRVARRIHDRLSTGPVLPHGCEDQWNTVRRAVERCDRYLKWLTLARRRDWLSEPTVLSDFLAQVADCREQLARYASSLDRPPRFIATVWEIWEDIRALEDEFDDVSWDKERSLSVTTPAIVLNDVPLGRFEIRLEWQRLGEQCSYRVIALEPNPAAKNCEVTHPHVYGEHLCEGDAKAPIAQALGQGRLVDFYLLVRQVLQSYNDSSPHIRLTRWYGITCGDCGRDFEEHELRSCECCGRSLCDGCLSDCPVCGTKNCTECATTCAQCKRDFCEPCMENQLCEDCDENANDHADAERGGGIDRETAIAAATGPTARATRASVHAHGVGQAAVS